MNQRNEDETPWEATRSGGTWRSREKRRTRVLRLEAENSRRELASLRSARPARIARASTRISSSWWVPTKDPASIDRSNHPPRQVDPEIDSESKWVLLRGSGSKAITYFSTSLRSLRRENFEIEVLLIRIHIVFLCGVSHGEVIEKKRKTYDETRAVLGVGCIADTRETNRPRCTHRI